MKWIDGENVSMEHNEPAFRSCHGCNAAHWHLKYTRHLMVCPGCDRYWVLGRYLDAPEFDSEGSFEPFFAGTWGMKPGQSTKDVTDEAVKAAEERDPEFQQHLADRFGYDS